MIWVLALLLAGLAAAPFVREAMRPAIGAAEQAEAPGEFAMLRDGATHFQWAGPEGGPVLVLIHGLSTPSFVWDAAVPGLTGLGFRVLRYDLWGRGYSDAPKGEQTTEMFLDQLDGLLAAQNVVGRISLMGYSMGGLIATAWAVRDADRVQHLGLVAPAGLRMVVRPGERMMRDAWVFGDWLIRWAGLSELKRRARDSEVESLVPQFRERLLASMERRGFAPAVLSSLRHTLNETFEAEHRRLARACVPVGVVWGELDLVIPPVCAEDLAQWNPEALQFVVPDADHALPHTHPDAVVEMFAELTDDFL